MKLKNNKGYVGVDVTIALMVLVILVPTITAMTFNINKTSNVIKRKTQALSIATNMLEISKIVFSDSDGLEDSDILENINNKITEIYPDGDSSEGVIIKTIDKVLYQMTISLQDKHEIDENVEEGKIKTVTAKVEYKLGNDKQEIELSTNFENN